MTSLPPLALLTALALALPMASRAQDAAPRPDELLQRIGEMAREGARQAATPKARVEVEIGQLDPRLKLAPCQKIQPYLPPGQPAWGRTRVGMRCVQGEKPWNVSIPVTVRVFIRSLVASASLPAGTTLDATQLAEEEIDMAAAPGAPVVSLEAAVGRTLSRPLAAGTALRQTDLRARQWFAAGENVRIVAVGPGWRIASEGQALTPGLEGQPARVRTEGGRVVQGRPVADREMEIAL